MEHDNQADVRRHARDTSAMAPKPGHHLGTASFRLGDSSIVQWLVEGPENDTISVNALVTNFRLTRYVRYRIVGTAVEALNDLPYSPFTPNADLDLEVTGPSTLRPTSVRIVFSAQRAPNGVDPDSAVACFRTDSDGEVFVTVSELRRGWEPMMSVIASFLGVTFCLADEPAEQACRLTVTDRTAGVQVSGDFVLTGGLRSSLEL